MVHRAQPSSSAKIYPEIAVMAGEGFILKVKLASKATLIVFFKHAGYSLIGFGIVLLSHILLFTIQVPPFLWQGLAADAAVLALVIGLTMLVGVPFAGLRQIGSAFLVLGTGTAMVSDADILVSPLLFLLGAVVLALVGGYLLVLKGTIKS